MLGMPPVTQPRCIRPVLSTATSPLGRKRSVRALTDPSRHTLFLDEKNGLGVWFLKRAIYMVIYSPILPCPAYIAERFITYIAQFREELCSLQWTRLRDGYKACKRFTSQVHYAVPQYHQPANADANDSSELQPSLLDIII